MTTEKRDFNKEAAAWDENPGRVKMAEEVFNSIKKNINLNKDMDVMDFGCGTGLLSLKLLRLVKTVTAADSSRGMLDVLGLKIQAQNLSNIKTLHIDIDKGDILTGQYDLITSSMTMHHIENIPPVISQFHKILKPHGCLCIADLDSDRGLFHDNNEGVFHEGFKRDEMKRMFMETGFLNISDVTAAKISKPDKNGSMNSFSVFLVTGEKK